MGYLARMAARNLWRNKRRTAFAMISVGLAVLLCVFLHGFMGGFISSIVRNYTKNDTGHVRITTREYASRAEMMPVDCMIGDPAAVEAAIRQAPDVAEGLALVAERIRFGVLLENGGLNASALAMAGDPVVEKDLLYLQRSLQTGGRYIEGPGEAIVGATLASTLKLSTSDALKVVCEASDGSLQMKKFRIVGLFRTGVGSLDDGVFQIPLADAKTMLRAGGAAQQIIIMLKDYHGAEKAAVRIADLLGRGELAVAPWSAIGDYPKLVQFQERAFGWMLLAVLFLGAFIVTNIMMMIVLERRREIGIIKSMGFSNPEVLGLFLLEGAFLGLGGSLAGAGLGFAINLALHFTGIDFTAMMSSLSYPMDNVIRTTLDIPATLGIAALGTVVAAVVSILPSRRASRMNVVEAIKSV